MDGQAMLSLRIRLCPVGRNPMNQSHHPQYPGSKTGPQSLLAVQPNGEISLGCPGLQSGPLFWPMRCLELSFVMHFKIHKGTSHAHLGRELE